MTRAGRGGALAALLVLAACDRSPGERGSGDGAAPGPGATGAAPGSDSAVWSDAAAPQDRAGAAPGARQAPRLAAGWRLANAVAGERYVVRAVTGGAIVEGRIVAGDRRGPPRRDTTIVPTHDLQTCRPFTETLVPSRDGGVGQAVVWLAGVGSGPPDTTAMRARLVLAGCRLEPRVLRVRLGSTLLVSSGDAMSSQLRFTPELDPARALAEVAFTDAGQVVPLEVVARAPGLVRVRDARHPWVTGLLAVAPHPWVAVTEADGAFRFPEVPPGRYTLVVWQEALGLRTQSIRVDASVRVRVTLEY